MRIISVGALKAFWEQPPHRDAATPLRTWVAVVKAAAWRNPADVKAAFNSADPIGDGRIVFDIGGNKYRLVAWINFRYATVYVRFIGTHAEYDRIDAGSV